LRFGDKAAATGKQNGKTEGIAKLWTTLPQLASGEGQSAEVRDLESAGSDLFFHAAS
jgi:hypothetical protein